MKEKIDENILRYENHQKTSIWSEFMAYRPIDEDASEGFVATGGASWSDVGLYGPVIRRSAGGISIDLEKLAVEMLICMKPMIEMDAGKAPVWSDQIREEGQLLK